MKILDPVNVYVVDKNNSGFAAVELATIVVTGSTEFF